MEIWTEKGDVSQIGPDYHDRHECVYAGSVYRTINGIQIDLDFPEQCNFSGDGNFTRRYLLSHTVW